MADANETNPPALWWSPKHGLITWKADQYAADGGTYWKRSTGGVSLRHDGHPNVLPADAVRLGDLSGLEGEVSRLRADLEKAHNYVGTLVVEFGTADLAEVAARARRALETPPDDEAVERALEPNPRGHVPLRMGTGRLPPRAGPGQAARHRPCRPPLRPPGHPGCAHAAEQPRRDVTRDRRRGRTLDRHRRGRNRR